MRTASSAGIELTNIVWAPNKQLDTVVAQTRRMLVLLRAQDGYTARTPWNATLTPPGTYQERRSLIERLFLARLGVGCRPVQPV
jgi:hypothetical protein